MKRISLAIAMALILVMGMAGLSLGAMVDWASWTSATPGSVSGAGASYTVTYSGEFAFAQINGTGTYFWTGENKLKGVAPEPYTSSAVENLPPTSDIIAQAGGSGSLVNTINFSRPVTNPVMAIVSLGQPNNYYVSYHFDQPFTILSYGPGWWGGPGTLAANGNILTGLEGDGTIQFLGTYTSISFTTPDYENWYGFTVGAPVPLPPTVLLLGSGLAGLGLLRRRWGMKA
jgi:hypothetical protein